MIVTAAVFAIALLVLVAFAPESARALAISGGSRRAVLGSEDAGAGAEPTKATAPPPSVPRPRVSPEGARPAFDAMPEVGRIGG